jgi:flagellar protein FliL
MAEPTEPAKTEGASGDAKGGAKKGKGLILIVLIAGVVALFGVAGFFLGSRLRPGPAQAQAKPVEEMSAETGGGKAEEKGAEKSGGHGGGEKEKGVGNESDYYEFEPFTVTLDTPRRDRFLVVTVILAIRPEEAKNVTKLLEKKKREVRSHLTLYLNSRSLDDVTGTKNLNRVLREMQDLINEYLWPDGKPMVTQVLLKNLAIQ